MKNHVLHIPFLASREDSPEHTLGMILAFGSLILYGTYNAFAKDLTNFLSPVSLLLITEALVALFVVLTIGLLPLLKALSKARGKELFIAGIIGILSSGIAPLLWFKGLTETSAVNASILTGSTIIFALFFDYFFLREKVNGSQIIGLSIIFLGIIFVALGPGESYGAKMGDLYIILKGVFFAAGTMLFKKYLTKMDPEAALFVRACTGMIFALIISAFIAHPFGAELKAFPLNHIAMLLAFVFFARFLNLTFFYGALDRIEANKVALIGHASPLTGMFFAVIILGEHLYPYHIIGALFIVFGLMLEHDVSGRKMTRAFIRAFRFRAHQQQP